MIKQFKTGYEAKTYLYSLKKFYEDRNLKNMESFECKGIEYGYVLEEALNLIGDFKNIDFDELRKYKIIFPEEYQKYLEENEQKLNGSTIKFKLSEEASEKIDEITNYLAEYWKVRLYRAFTVKIVLKYLYLKLIEKKEF